MEFISKNKNEPFFIYLATNIPHSPWNVLNEWREEYSNANLKESEMDFLSTISRFDRNFGRLREFIYLNKLDDNTILEKPVNNQDTHILFILDLKPGPKTVRAGLIDVNGKKQGAYYVYVKKI